MSQLSWHLNFHINDVRTLFSSQILPYEVDCYVCSCGKIKTIIKQAMDSSIKYSCEDCENESFTNANDYNNNYIWYEKVEDLLPEEILFTLKPNIEFDENKKTVYADISIDIPKIIDFASEEVFYNKKSIFEIKTNLYNQFEKILKANFNIYSKVDDYDRYFRNITENDLINQNIFLSNYQNKILKELHSQSKSKVLKKTETLEQFEFFLNNDNLLDIDFFYWKDAILLPDDKPLNILNAIDFVINYRKEKTLKKSVLYNYKFQMRKYKSYDFMYIYSLCRYIKDINILNRMININLKSHISFMDDSYYLYRFIEFLSSKFSDIQIERLFLSYEKNEPFWLTDSVALFSELLNDLDNFYISKCKFDMLHTDIVKYHQIILEKKLFKIQFDYDEKFKKACVNIEDYEIKLPLNGTQLYDWSNKLQNCLSGYWKLIKDKKTIVYGFYKDNEIKFAVEIRDNKIVQSKLKYNQELLSREMSLVLGWFKEYFEDIKKD